MMLIAPLRGQSSGPSLLPLCASKCHGLQNMNWADDRESCKYFDKVKVLRPRQKTLYLPTLTFSLASLAQQHGYDCVKSCSAQDLGMNGVTPSTLPLACA